MGGAAGVEVRHSRGAHFRFVFVTISGNISNLEDEIFLLQVEFKYGTSKISSSRPKMLGLVFETYLIIEMISLRGSVGQRSILVKVVKLLDL